MKECGEKGTLLHCWWEWKLAMENSMEVHQKTIHRTRNYFTELGKKNEKKPTTWRLNNMLLKNPWINEEIKEEIKKYLETNANEDKITQNLWDAAKSSGQREIHSDTGLPQKKKKYLILTT